MRFARVSARRRHGEMKRPDRDRAAHQSHGGRRGGRGSCLVTARIDCRTIASRISQENRESGKHSDRSALEAARGRTKLYTPRGVPASLPLAVCPSRDTPIAPARSPPER